MIDVKEIARGFVLSRFSVRESFFQSAWRIISTPSAVALAPGRTKGPFGRLAIAGDEENEAVLAVMIFVDASKQVAPLPNADELAAACKVAASKYETNERLLREILDYVRGVKAAGRPRSRTVVQLWTNESGSFLGPIEIKDKDVNDYIERKKDFEILIIDEDKFFARKIGDVYVNGNLITDKQLELETGNNTKLSSAGFRFLVHLLRHDGDGGTSLDVAKAVWFYDKRYLKRMQKAWDENIEKERGRKDPFDEESTRRIKKEKTTLNYILKRLIEVELSMDAAFEVSHHIMTTVPKFCLIAIQVPRFGGHA